MTASDNDLLNLNGPLASLVSKRTAKEASKQILFSVKNKYTWFFYLIFFVLSYFVNFILK